MTDSVHLDNGCLTRSPAESFWLHSDATSSHCFSDVFRGRTVLVTGHTGFKGSWLSSWLLRLGAKLHGVALEPQPHETLFSQLSLPEQLTRDHRADVRDASTIAEIVATTQPDFLFHLAAQPLVRESYRDPAGTFATNVMGTVNVLDAVRQLAAPCNVVVVTTDKCYENREWLSAYREDDAMGGHDPYSASKGCAELVTSSYRRSFFHSVTSSRIASARAGNVIGGGDWARDRIVPDIFRAVQGGQAVPVRNRHATRPWQHVLEPLSGYLWLAAALDGSPSIADGRAPSQYCTAFNFGPNLASNQTVADVVQAILKITGGEWVDQSDPNAPHEASNLNLAVDRAFHLLGWKPVWSFAETISQTASFYQQVKQGRSPVQIASEQTHKYEQDAANQGVPWALSVAACESRQKAAG